eukprot:TRINITY_DN680_c0_g1_i3.p1 TRINITY_DN680_c0_g1~~TRINITY_DN680_c0_g1_i3.p1  ORF type:complete len:644 (-),score=177.21 TRINITY_DN680_c0_g1_i3:41-1699(-)
MTREEIMQLIEPSQDVQMETLKWIKKVASSVGPQHVPEIDHQRDAIVVKSTSFFAETLFKTEMHVFVNERNNMATINHMGPLSVPTVLTSHITMVTGITELPPVSLKAKKSPVVKRQTGDNQCNVPYTIKELYSVPQNLFITQNQSQIGIYAEPSLNVTEEFGLGSVEYYQAALGLPRNPITCILGNGVEFYSPGDDDDDTEANLDTEMATGMAPNAFTCFFIMEQGDGWMYDFTRELFSTPNAPLVISMSYGWNEDMQCDTTVDGQPLDFVGNCTALHLPNSQAYVNLTNSMFMKLGLLGHTILASSGDGGVAGNHGTMNNCLTQAAIFPTASPYVLSVGATSVEASSQDDLIFDDAVVPPICQPNNNYSCVCTTSTNEQPALSTNSAGFDTGGGFSIYDPQPSYQQKAVQAYLNSGVTLPASIYFNKNNRGYPDVSAVGDNICLLDPDSQCNDVGGTSASTPIWAGLVAHLNNDRFAAGKTSLGFINQAIYDMFNKGPKQYFNNGFSSGNNNGGCPASMGFNSQAFQWTPLTGVGSPKFDQIRKYFAALP